MSKAQGDNSETNATMVSLKNNRYFIEKKNKIFNTLEVLTGLRERKLGEFGNC